MFSKWARFERKWKDLREGMNDMGSEMCKCCRFKKAIIIVRASNNSTSYGTAEDNL